jgi:hypothetical protein
VDFSAPFQAITNFRQATRRYVISRDIFALHLCKLAPLKDGKMTHTILFFCVVKGTAADATDAPQQMLRTHRSRCYGRTAALRLLVQPL